MRHLILRNALFCCTFAALLTGCTAQQDTPDFTPQLADSFTAEAEMEYGEGKTAHMQLTRCTAKLWEAEFTEPNTLAGVTLTFDGNAVSASYKGLEFSVPKSALPAKNMLGMLTEALDSAAAAGQLPCSTQEDGSLCYSAECAGGAYTLTFAENGEPLVFDLPSQPMKITFSGYTCLAATAETTAADTAAASTAAVTETSAETIQTNEGTSA